MSLICTHTHTLAIGSPIFDTCREVGGAAVLAGYLWHHDIIRPGDGVLCHALFGFPAVTVLAITPALVKHVSGGYNWDWHTTVRRGKKTYNNNPGGECVRKNSGVEHKCVIITRCCQSQSQLSRPMPPLFLNTSVTPDPHTHPTTLTVCFLWHTRHLSTPSYSTYCMMVTLHVM